jgi:hypothetical protein
MVANYMAQVRINEPPRRVNHRKIDSYLILTVEYSTKQKSTASAVRGPSPAGVFPQKNACSSFRRLLYFGARHKNRTAKIPLPGCWP